MRSLRSEQEIMADWQGDLAMKNLRSEEEIIQKWSSYQKKPLVSICCTTYNHESYIENALVGFLIQETEFPFEILIHDDASTDKTADIIRKYEAQYSKIIKPIYQTENQYSQGKSPNIEFNYPRVRGEYIALCEGDDYWIKKDKLSTQLYVLLKDKSISVSFHPAIEYNCQEKTENIICKHLNYDSYINTKDSIVGRGGFMPTASMVFPSRIIKNNTKFLAKKFPIGDFFLQMILSFSGRIYYHKRIFCVYRRNSLGSWTSKMQKKANYRKYYCSMGKPILHLFQEFRSNEYSKHLSIPLFFYNFGCFKFQKGIDSKILYFFRTFPIKTKDFSFCLYYLYFFMRQILIMAHRKMIK